MGFFFKALAAMVTADAIDRYARRPPKYWYPNQQNPPASATSQPHPPAAGQARQRDWDLEHPRRPG
jgi:hypothetical protein